MRRRPTAHIRGRATYQLLLGSLKRRADAALCHPNDDEDNKQRKKPSGRVHHHLAPCVCSQFQFCDEKVCVRGIRRLGRRDKQERSHPKYFSFIYQCVLSTDSTTYIFFRDLLSTYEVCGSATREPSQFVRRHTDDVVVHPFFVSSFGGNIMKSRARSWIRLAFVFRDHCRVLHSIL